MLLLERFRNLDISFKALLFISLLFALAIEMGMHICILPPEECKMGQNVWMDVNEITILPFSFLDIPLYMGLSVLVAILLLLICFISKKLQSLTTYGDPNLDVPRLSFKVKIILFFLLILFWSPYILSWLPGGIYSDTYRVIKASDMGIDQINNRYTVLYFLIWYIALAISHLFGKSVFFACILIMLLQIFLMAFSAIYFMEWLTQFRFKRIVLILSFLFFCLFPLFPLYAMSQWKDTFFSIFLFIFSLKFADDHVPNVGVIRFS